LGLILVSALLRIPAFFLKHNNNDELIHLSLAMKIDRYGMRVFPENYNLFNTDITAKEGLLILSFSKEKIGTLLKNFVAGERELLSHHPPALCALLTLSHNLLTRNGPYAVAGGMLRKSEVKAQFYACLVTFIFSILLIAATYWFGKVLFNDEIGILAAALLSITPIELLSSQKIWAEDMVGFFATLALIPYFYCLKKNNPIFACLAGLSCGIAMLSKMSGGFIIIAIVIFHLWQNRQKFFRGGKEILGVFLDKNILLFALFFLFIAGPWLYIYIHSFGTSWTYNHFIPGKINLIVLPSGFMRFVHSRPWYTYFVATVFQMPFYFLVYPALYYLFKEKNKELQFLFALLAVFFTLLTLKADKEERYFMPAYPAIAIVTAYTIHRIGAYLRKKQLYLLEGILVLLFILGAFYSINLGMALAFRRSDLIGLPV